MSDGIRVANESDIDDGSAIVVAKELLGTDDNVAVFNDGGDFFALDDTCTHEDASLADGWIENGEVECPLHAAKFCLTTGEALCMPATAPARTHRVVVRDGEVFILTGSAAAADA